MVAALFIAAALSATNAPVASVAAATDAMPPRMVSTWNQAQRELRRTAGRQADGTLDVAAAAKRRMSVGRAFERVCRQKGISEESIRYWRQRLDAQQ